MADIQKSYQDALAQQKTEFQSLLEKQKANFQAQMAQKIVAQKVQAPAPQTVEPVRQPRGPPSSLNTEEGMKDYYITKFLKDIGIFSQKELDSDYPIKPFQRPHLQQSNVSTRINRLEEGINETRDTVN